MRTTLGAVRSRLRARRWWAIIAAVVAAGLVAIPAIGAPTTNLTIDPGATEKAPGFTDLRGIRYAEAKKTLDQLSEITLPVEIPGLQAIGVDNVQFGANDDGHSLSLSGHATLPLNGEEQDVDLLLTAVWPDDSSTEPQLAIAARTTDVSLSRLNPLWDGTYGDVRFVTARLAISAADQRIDPALLPAEAQDFYPEPVELTGGVNFAGDLQLGDRLEEAFSYAGYSGEVAVKGSLSASAASLFGNSEDADLGDLHLAATLGRSPSAPAWIADRTSIYSFAIVDGRPSLSVAEDVTVAVDGTTNHFQGTVAIAPTGAVTAEAGLVGTFDAPFGLDVIDAAKLTDIKLRLSSTGGGLAFGVDLNRGVPVQVDASFTSSRGATRADFSIEGAIRVSSLLAFSREVLGIAVPPIPGADNVSLDKISFSLAKQRFSVTADATINQLGAKALLTVHEIDGRGEPLLGLSLIDPGCGGDCIRVSALLPQAGDTLGALKLPALHLTATTLERLDAAAMTPQEAAYFRGIYRDMPDTVDFSPGLNLEGRLPLDALGVSEALGFPQGSEVTLAGTLGADVTLSQLEDAKLRLNGLALRAELPAAANGTILPSWVRPAGATTLEFSYANGTVAASFATGADVTVGGRTFPLTISGRLARSGQRTSIGFTGTITNWQQPFGITWAGTLSSATVKLETAFGGGQPATVDARVIASTLLGGKRFELEFGLSRTDSLSASLTARFADKASLGEIAGLFPGLAGPRNLIAGNGELKNLMVGPVAATATVGGANTGFELTGSASYRSLAVDVLVAARATGGFTVGIKPKVAFGLRDLVPSAPSSVDVRVTSAAMVLASEAGAKSVAQLTDGEFAFYKTLYGCSTLSTRETCTAFKTLQTASGVKLIGAFDFGSTVKSLTAALGIQTANVMLEGTIPLFGATDFSLKASLGNLTFAKAPVWFESGSLSLEIGTNGIAFTGGMSVKITRQGATQCTGGTLRDGVCYDLLDFSVSARVALQPTAKITLSGALKADRTWQNAFGLNWLQIRHLALQLGVSAGSNGPEVTLGFAGDITLGTKDVAASLKVGVAPSPPPAPPRVNLIGFSVASTAGIALSDLLWLNQQVTGKQLQTNSLPDVSLRNLFLQFSQETDVDLCLKQGIRFNADLYVGSNLVPATVNTDDPGGCRNLDPDPDTPQNCIANKAQGCVARIYGSLDASGLVAGGELRNFQLGPVGFGDTVVSLALSTGKQLLRLKGGVTIGASGYEFASGQANLDISSQGFSFSGDAALFNKAMQGHLEATAPFNLTNPSFTVKAWLRDDGRATMANLVGATTANLKPAIIAVGNVVNLISGSGSVANIRDLPTWLESAGVTVPSEVRTMADVLGRAQDDILRYAGPALQLDPLLKGLSFGFPGTRGAWIGPVCTGVVINGTCWLLPPATISIPGICSALGIPNTSSDCSWAGLMARYVRPALIGAIKSATGLNFSDAAFDSTLQTLLNRIANGTGAIINVDCAYFSADATELAKGNVNVALATKLRLFGQPVEFGASWNFKATGGSPEEVTKNLLRTLFAPSSITCPAMPAGVA